MALLRKMTCNLRHPMGFRHRVHAFSRLRSKSIKLHIYTHINICIRIYSFLYVHLQDEEQRTRLLKAATDEYKKASEASKAAKAFETVSAVSKLHGAREDVKEHVKSNGISVTVPATMAKVYIRVCVCVYIYI